MNAKNLFSILTALAILVGSLVFPRPASAGPNGCGPENEWYGISGTQDASGAYIGPVTISMGSSCRWVVLFKFIVDDRLVHESERSYGEYYTIYSAGTHTINFMFDTGGGAQVYGPFVATIIIDRPPSVSGSVVCDQWGTGGWCRSNARLSLSASDPQGYALSISGTTGTAFSCGASCAISLPSGIGTATYTATSASSGMTASGATDWYYDPQPPIIFVSAAGNQIQGGWFSTPVDLSATASDTAWV